MKKIIYLFGIIALTLVTILNILFTAHLDINEHITIVWNSLWYILGAILIGVFLFGLAKIADKYLCKEDTAKKKKIRKVVLLVALAIYVLFSVAWVILIRPGIGGDQIHAGNIAQTFYRGNDEEFLPNTTYAGIPLIEYMQVYSQQITLSFVFSVFFRILHFDGLGVLRGVNVICNFLTIVALYKIGKQLSKTYKMNFVLLFTLALTLISLPMLATFIYGDIPSLTLCLFAVYFTMKYAETKNWKYLLASSALTMVAYMMRMNCLIFIIATVMYLLLHLLKEIKQKPWKENMLKIGMIVVYLVISIVPSSLVKSYYISKYHLDKNKEMPTINYIYMATMEGPRGNGWYSEEIGEYALKNPEKAKEEYPEKLKERLAYFSQHIGYTADFYTMKTVSMWAENTYSALNNNGIEESYGIPLALYQKALLLVITTCSLIVLIQNRKKLSLEILFLNTIFIGGFAFHLLWEAKSRYIIPYIIILIPVACIGIQGWKKNKFTKN